MKSYQNVGKIIHLSILFGLGFFLPLLFSHVLVGIGGPIIWPTGYEFLKRGLVGVGIVYIWCTPCMRKPRKIPSFLPLWLILGGVVVLHILSGASIWDIFLGSPTFYYGVIYTGLILGIFQTLRCLSLEEGRAIQLGLLSSFPFVALYAVSQYIGYDFLTYATSFSGDRVFSALGNPAHLAFYSLLILFIFDPVGRWRPLIYLVVLGITFLSGTYWIGGITFGLFCIELIQRCPVFLAQWYPYRWHALTLALTTLILVVFFIKSGTIQVRLWLIFDSLSQFLVHPRAWIIGFTPLELDILYREYMTHTTPLIDSRFAIGHTHNLFLESILRFGGIFTGCILWMVYRSMKSSQTDPNIRWMVGVFVLVSLVHIPEITHFFMLAVAVWYLSTKKCESQGSLV